MKLSEEKQFRTEMEEGIANLMTLKDKAARHGMWGTFHAIDAAIRVLGWETAAVLHESDGDHKLASQCREETMRR